MRQVLMAEKRNGGLKFEASSDSTSSDGSILPRSPSLGKKIKGMLGFQKKKVRRKADVYIYMFTYCFFSVNYKQLTIYIM
jgi:hypothetical protein